MKPQVCLRQALAGAGEHRLARVDARPARVRVQREHAQRRLARSGSELEHRAGLETECRRDDGVFELLIARDLVEHLSEIGLGIPLELGHAPTIAPARLDR